MQMDIIKIIVASGMIVVPVTIAIFLHCQVISAHRKILLLDKLNMAKHTFANSRSILIILSSMFIPGIILLALCGKLEINAISTLLGGVGGVLAALVGYIAKPRQ